MLDYKQPIETGDIPDDGPILMSLLWEVVPVVPRQRPSTR